MSSPKILVIEDEELLALTLKNQLQKLGYGVPEITNSVEEAIQRIAEINPILVLIGNRLAGTMKGARVADIIISTYQVPVFYLAEYPKIKQLCQHLVKEAGECKLKKCVENDLRIAIEIALYEYTTQRKLQEEARKFTAIFKSMGYGVIITDANGCIQMMNLAAEGLIACRHDEAIGKNLVEILNLVDKDTRESGKDSIAQAIQKSVAFNLPDNYTLITYDNRELQIEGSLAPIHHEEGKVDGTVFVFQDITHRKQIEAQLIRNAFYDALTGIPNRVLFLERLGQAFERGKRRKNYRFAVLFLDLDGFKFVNDTFGHSIGDELLIEIARRLEASLRGGDTVARFGGDEFAVLVEDIKDDTDATNVAQRIQETLRLPLYINNHQMLISASIGIALSCSDYDEPSKLLQDADVAMYCSKKQGKACHTVFHAQQSLMTGD
ncbi:MAG: diguanylate cyclase [Scytonema sp. PMC 1069.18]|nr:diguanylate cyclase [Scytonema sp. PMC 1069.18]MEC4885357.1 diguanylate cyclase [Scytonema sp. PMC 1070.18]